MKIGLKLWSTNTFYIPAAKELHKRQIYGYIELFVEPNTTRNVIEEWANLGIPLVFHAPHSYCGFNFALQSFEDKNRALLAQINDHIQIVRPEKIIFHSGSVGNIEEVYRQLRLFVREFKDVFSLAAIENKPAIGLKGESLVGSNRQEIAALLKEGQCGFCLDVGHAIAAAAYYNVNCYEFLEGFLELNPAIIHISDGDVGSIHDSHLHLGCGNFDFPKILSLLKKCTPGFVTIETNKDSKENLNDFEQDAVFLGKLKSL